VACDKPKRDFIFICSSPLEVKLHSSYKKYGLSLCQRRKMAFATLQCSLHWIRFIRRVSNCYKIRKRK